MPYLALLKSPWLYVGILAALLAGQGYLLKHSWENAAQLKEQLKVKAQEVELAVKTNENQTSTVHTLQAQIQNMVDERAVEQQKWSAELAIRDLKMIAAQKDAIAQRKERDAMWNSTQGCKAYATMRVDQMCRSASDKLHERLRQRPSGTGQN